MVKDKTLALQLKDLLTVCLAKGIDAALSAQIGEQWYLTFAEEEATQKQPIIYPNQTSIYACDMQALFKMLRYREKYASIILTYFNFIPSADAPEAPAKMAQFSRMMNRLITEFRNRMEAHIPVYAIENSTIGTLYTYADAITDMLKLAKIFRYVRDDNDECYYDRMTRLVDEHTRQKNTAMYALTDVIAALQLDAPTDKVLACCEELHIPVTAVDSALYIGTTDYAADLSRIRAYFAIANADRSKKTHRILIGVIAALTVVVLLVGAIVLMQSLPPSPENNYYEYSGSITVTPQKIDLVPQHIYWDDNELVAECAVVNGFDHSVSSITVNNFSVSNDNGIIAKKDFGVIADGKSLAEGACAMWTFRFEADCVYMPVADLTDGLSITCHIPKF